MIQQEQKEVEIVQEPVAVFEAPAPMVVEKPATPQQPFVEENDDDDDDSLRSIHTHSEASIVEEMVSPAKQEVRTIPLELRLPRHMELLLKFQQSLDSCINLLISTRQTVPTFTSIKGLVESQIGRTFSMTHFQQILKVAPTFYNHKWEMKMKMELIVTCPRNSDELVNDGSAVPSEESMIGSLAGSIIMKRQKIFKQHLLRLAVNQYNSFRASRAEDASDIYYMKQWPSLFDVEEHVKEIEPQALKEQPKQYKGYNVNQFISQHDTKQETQEIMKEVVQRQQ